MNAPAESIRQQWRTPPDLFALLSELWGPFELDATASHDSALCERFNAPGFPDRYQWSECSPVFCNPPFSRAGFWARHARDRWTEDGCRSVLILPSSTNSRWWHEVKADALTLFPMRRIQFLPPDGIPASTNSRDCMLLLFGYGHGCVGSIDLQTNGSSSRGSS